MTDYKQAYEKLLKEKVMLMKKLRERRQETIAEVEKLIDECCRSCIGVKELKQKLKEIKT